MVAVGSFSQIFGIFNAYCGEIISKIILPGNIESACTVSATNNHVYVGCYDGKMYCIEIMTGTIIWYFKTDAQIKCTACLCLDNEAIAFGSYDKTLYCVNVDNGALNWKTYLAESITSRVMYYDHKLYVATTFGTCLCLMQENGKILWKSICKKPVFGSPCIIENTEESKIVWPDVDGTLHCFSCINGEEQWTFKADGNIFSSLMIYKHFIIFGCQDCNIYCVEVNNNCCLLKYKTALDSSINATPCLANYEGKHYIISATVDGNVYIIDFSSGNIQNKVFVGGHIFSSPSCDRNCIYVGCRDNYLYCVTLSKILNKV